MTNFLEMSAFHAFEKTYFISITAGILCPIFQISVLPALQILCQSSALKNLCQRRCIIPPTSSLPLLMWQNKPRPIRIKALKRSLKPLKVPLNWGMTIWAVWQQMLNGVIASPPQRGLLSHNTQAYKHSHMRVRLFVPAHANNLQHPPFTRSTAVVFYSTRIELINAESVQHFFFFFSFLKIFLLCFFFALNCQSWLWHQAFAVSELLPRMKTNKQTWQYRGIFFSPLMICSFQDTVMSKAPSKRGCWKVKDRGTHGRMWAAGGRHEREESKPTCVCSRSLYDWCEWVLCLLKT